jgi:hypothetical protein
MLIWSVPEPPASPLSRARAAPLAPDLGSAEFESSLPRTRRNSAAYTFGMTISLSERLDSHKPSPQKGVHIRALRGSDRILVLGRLLAPEQQRLPCLLQMPAHVLGQHAEEDVGPDPVLDVVADGPHPGVPRPQGAKGPLGMRQLNRPGFHRDSGLWETASRAGAPSW